MMVVCRHSQHTFQYNQLVKVHVPLYDLFKDYCCLLFPVFLCRDLLYVCLPDARAKRPNVTLRLLILDLLFEPFSLNVNYHVIPDPNPFRPVIYCLF